MKLGYLDGLRGVAAVIVLINHLVFMYMPFAINGVQGGGQRYKIAEWIHNTPLYLLVDGNLAVSIFFILSGIVLSARFFRTGDRSVVAVSAVKRYFRLAIPVFGSVILAYGLVKAGAMFNYQAGLAGSAWWRGFWQFPADFGQAVWQGTIGAFLTEENSYNPVLWTMKYEFLGSFLVFIVLALFGKLRNRWIFYALLILYFWQTFYLAFILGIVMSDYYFSNSRQAVRRFLSRGYWIPLLVGSLILGSYPITSVEETMFEELATRYAWFTPEFAHILAAFGILAAIMSAPILKRLLLTRPAQFLGRISFPLYLLHFLVLGSYTSYLFINLEPVVGAKWAATLTVPPTIIIIFIAAYLYARYVDEPAIRFSGWIYRRWFEQPKRMAPSPAPAEASPKPVVQSVPVVQLEQ